MAIVYRENDGSIHEILLADSSVVLDVCKRIVELQGEVLEVYMK